MNKINSKNQKNKVTIEIFFDDWKIPTHFTLNRSDDIILSGTFSIPDDRDPVEALKNLRNLVNNVVNTYMAFNYDITIYSEHDLWKEEKEFK